MALHLCLIKFLIKMEFFFKLHYLKIIKIEDNDKRYFSIIPMNDLENFFNFNVKIDNYNKESIKNLSIIVKMKIIFL